MDADKLREQQILEQGIAQAADMWPRLWRSLFTGCIEQGFTEAQAMACVMTYISASSKPS